MLRVTRVRLCADIPAYGFPDWLLLRDVSSLYQHPMAGVKCSCKAILV